MKESYLFNVRILLRQHQSLWVSGSKFQELLRQILTSAFQLPVWFSLIFSGFTAILLIVMLPDIIIDSDEVYQLIGIRQVGRDFDNFQPHHSQEYLPWPRCIIFPCTTIIMVRLSELHSYLLVTKLWFLVVTIGNRLNSIITQRHDMSIFREIELRLDTRSASGRWFASDFTLALV
jgi:hypothetical protein